MGKKGKGYRREEEEVPVKKKNMITEEQLMDKSHMDRTEYVPLLPTESLYFPFDYKQTSCIVVKKIVSDLNYLLYTDFKNFWATVLYNPSFKNCLSTSLAYLHRRWMNNYVYSNYSNETEEEFMNNSKILSNYQFVKNKDIYQCMQGLAQVLLIIYHRIISFNKENKELSDLYKISEEITRKYIIDFPKLFEIAEIYGETNSDIVKFIIKMYSKTLPTFYQTLTTSILPIIFSKMHENIRKIKNLSERQEYGVNYSYKRLNGRDLSQGEEQLIKKINILMEIIGFINIINNIIRYFPEDCEDHCYFNSQVQFIYENIFLQLQVAYKVWNYQKQQYKILPMINFILKECTEYFSKFFDRCNDIIVLRNKKSSTVQAYLNSLQRVFKQFGKRNSVTKKNQTRNMIMYKIVQKKFNVLKMAQDMYAQQTEEELGIFNLQYLKDFIIVLQNQLKDQYINQNEPRQEEIQQQTEAPVAEREDSFDEEEDKVHQMKEEKDQTKEQKEHYEEKQSLLEELQVLVPKRMRSEDYYTKLYANFSSKFYKGEYEDDYDDIADYDKRPLFFEQNSSDSESESQNERHLVSNISNLQHVKSLHDNHRVDRQKIRNNNANKPKYERVSNPQPENTVKYQQKTQKVKPKYVEKKAEESNYLKQVVQGLGREKEEQARVEAMQDALKEEEEEKRGGQGYKKSNKSHNYKPKQHEPYDKHRNTNKNKEFDKHVGGGNGNRNKKY